MVDLPLPYMPVNNVLHSCRLFELSRMFAFGRSLPVTTSFF